MNTIYILLAIIIMLAVSWVVKLISLRQRSIQKYLPTFSAFQLIIWAVIIFWIIHTFYAGKSYYDYLIVILGAVLILLVVWFYLKDIVAGFLFRVKHNPVRGQLLNDGVIRGTVQRIGLSFLTVEKMDGESFRIPYSAIINQTLSLQFKHTEVSGKVTVKLETPVLISPAYLEHKIRQTLAMSSWCIASKPIDVEPVNENYKLIKVSFFLIDPAYRPMAEKNLSQLIDELSREDRP